MFKFLEKRGRKITVIKNVAALSFLVPLFITKNLWLGESARFYPTTPILSFLPPVPFPLDHIIFWALVALLTGTILIRRPIKLLGLFLALSLIYSFWDQSRWMPYYYQFWFMLLALWMFYVSKGGKREEKNLFGTLGIILISIWFWSGTHKLNATYIFFGFQWMTEPFLEYFPWLTTLSLAGIALTSALVELCGAIFLLFKKTRRDGVVLITLMHSAILVIFGPVGKDWNPSVWSWNVAMIIFVAVIFWDDFDHSAKDLSVGNGLFHRGVAILFGVMPLFNFFGLWDDFLSHALYSWTTQEAKIEILAPHVKIRLPEEVSTSIVTHGDREYIDMLLWSYTAFESPPYHAKRVFKNAFNKLCKAVNNSDSIRLIIFEKPHWRTGIAPTINYSCEL